MPTPKDWLVLCSVMASTAALCFGQVTPGVPAVGPAAPAAASASGAEDESARHEHDRVIKAIDDLKWHLQLGAVAEIDKVTYTSAPVPRRGQANPTAPGAANPLIISAYTFIPKQLNRTRKQPLLVLVHGGVHANFNTGALHIVRELLEQGYTVLAPDYRGSTGYGRSFYEAIDYGGLENEDVHAGVLWMLEAYSFLDSKRVGIMGWSHGGMITLMNIFEHPQTYAAAYAGVPVSDLVARMGYSTDAYRRLFSAPYHIGKTAREDIQEYLRRSPVTHAAKLATPLLIHSNTNDEDVNVLEVQRLIAALKAEGKKFEHKIYQDVPGGHSFNRLHTRVAKESRGEIYRFLAQYLKPERAAGAR